MTKENIAENLSLVSREELDAVVINVFEFSMLSSKGRGCQHCESIALTVEDMVNAAKERKYEEERYYKAFDIAKAMLPRGNKEALENQAKDLLTLTDDILSSTGDRVKLAQKAG